MNRTKVCIVSLHKTGTTSISEMLIKFEFLVTGPDTNLYYDLINNKYEQIDSFLDKFDVFQDDPWYDIFEYVDSKFNQAKFIYLIRDENFWLKSMQNFYGKWNYNNKVRTHFYGNCNTLDHPELYRKKYRSHEKRVYEYFEGKENFIEIDVRIPEDAERLQKFLGLENRFKNFPHLNKTPKNNFERRIKRFKLFVRGYFGLSRLLKVILIKTLSRENYLELRNNIRYNRSILKKTKIRFQNLILKRNR